jgi:hypothetical protein
MEPKDCPVCRDSEIKKLREDLSKCQKSNRAKEQTLKKLNKKVFIGTLIGVAILAIFGKEALDSISEALESVQGFGSQFGKRDPVVLPAPGTLGLMAIAVIATRPRRRRKST